MNEPNSARTRPPRPEEADTRPPTRADHTPSGYNPRDGGLRFGPPAAADEIGTLGRFRVQKELGHGGMGAVYLAFDTQLHRPIALKVMLPQLATNRTTKERFIREARSAAQISHDNVIGILDAGEIDGVPFIAMPFLQGYPLDEFLHKKGTPSTNQILRIGREMALGLAAAHDLGVIHRDIKPGNVWLEAPNGRVKILDFGLAKPQDEDKELTHTGQIMGTPAYMAPEQAAGEKVDHRADLYSLGTVLYRLVGGRTPFEPARDMMSMLVALALDEPKPLRELKPTVPPALAELVHELLRKDRTARPQSGKEVAKRLGAMLKHSLAGGREPPQTEDVLPATAPLPIAPVQPTPYVAVPITAQNNVSAFEEIDEAPRRIRRRKGNGNSVAKVVWLIAALVAAVAGVVIVNQIIPAPKSLSAEGKTNRRTSLDTPAPPIPAKDAAPPSGGSPTSVFSDVTPTSVFTKPVTKSPIPADGWVPLTAGKALADWDAFQTRGWSLNDGILSGDGAAFGWLGTKQDYTDFELELEYRIFPKGNSGIFLRAWDDGQGTGGNFVELQLLDNSAYAELAETQKNGAIHNKIAPNPYPVSPVDLWNKLHVSVIGKRVTATFNGTKCIDADVTFPRAAGRIGLQQYRTPVDFRNVRVRDLSAVSKAGPWENLFPADEKPFYTRRWEAMGSVKQVKYGSNAVWVEGDYLAWIRTKKAYTDFELELEFKPLPRANSGIFLRTPASYAWNDVSKFIEVELSDDRTALNLNPNRLTGSIFSESRRRGDPKLRVNDWNDVRVKATGKRITVLVNGVECVDREVESLAASGHIGLQADEYGLEFRNVRVRELKD